MSDANKSEKRRKLLKSLAAGSGAVIAGKSLPDQWTRPVVDSVLLPSHAQTSGGPFGGNNIVVLGKLDSDNMLAKALDAVISPARAGDISTSFNLAYCITPISDTVAKTAVIVTPADGCPHFANLWTNDNVEVNSGPQPMVLTPYCTETMDAAASSDWLEKLGLLNDAMASLLSTIELTSIQGGATGTFVAAGGFTDNFNHTGPCADMSKVDCCGEIEEVQPRP
ncbi:MAG: hypothetical protein ACWA5Q_03795 [bacterium]